MLLSYNKQGTVRVQNHSLENALSLSGSAVAAHKPSKYDG